MRTGVRSDRAFTDVYGHAAALVAIQAGGTELSVATETLEGRVAAAFTLVLPEAARVG